MENAIAMTQLLISKGNTLLVAVLNAANNCNVPVADLLAAVSK